MKPSPFTHRIRVRYAEVDGQGVVFNAHWLTYFDEASTRFIEVVSNRYSASRACASVP